MTPLHLRNETRRRLNEAVALLCPDAVPHEHDVEALRRVRDRLAADWRWLNSVLPMLERDEAVRARQAELVTAGKA
jgi:hypothetical protein